MNDRAKLTTQIENALLFLWGIFFLFFPFVISTATTDNFILPKQIFLIVVVLVTLLLWAAKMIIAKKVFFRRTPLDVPIALFGLALILSTVFAVDRYDSLIAITPLLIAIIGYFVLVNTLRRENALVFIIAAIITSAAGVSLIALFSYFKVYPIPLSYTHIPNFTTLGTLLEQGIFLVAILPIALQLSLPILKGDTEGRTLAFGVATILIAAGLGITLLQLATTQKPLILPFETGFQTAFAAISQDTGRIAQGFFFGDGFGNFAVAFTKFKQASFNTNAAIWPITFTGSSSYILELLATTGIVGFLTFLMILFRALIQPSKKKSNPIYYSLVILAAGFLIVPSSFQGVTLFLLLLSIFIAVEALKHPSHFFDIEPRLVALKKGLIVLHQTTEESHERYEYNNILPIVLSAVIVILVAVVGFYSGKFLIANADFQNSLVAANNNNGAITYKYQVAAINMFPYQSSYYRIFSQTNMALANSIAVAQPKGSSPSAQVQSTIYNLLQQGITAARTATSLSPEAVANWQNLSSVYRALIGLGQNADTFAVQASQQAIILDPANPEEYVNLGGIYYQLQQYDNAIRVFQQATTLKQDYPNAYYNLAHAYLMKNDPQDALAALQIVKQLTVNNKTNYDKVVAEINQIQQNSPSAQPPQSSTTPTPAQQGPTIPTSNAKKTPAGPQQPLSVQGQQNTIPATTSPIPLASPTPTK